MDRSRIGHWSAAAGRVWAQSRQHVVVLLVLLVLRVLLLMLQPLSLMKGRVCRLHRRCRVALLALLPDAMHAGLG
jgi:hypothetical protein